MSAKTDLNPTPKLMDQNCERGSENSTNKLLLMSELMGEWEGSRNAF